jgi:hypothetical protein
MFQKCINLFKIITYKIYYHGVLSFIIKKLGNLDAILRGHFKFKLCFIMAKVDNLDANLGDFFDRI